MLEKEPPSNVGASSSSSSSVGDLPQAHEHTNSVNRSLQDLNEAAFVFYAGALCAARTAIQQPINLALTRKQTCGVAASLSTAEILRRIHRHEGGLHALSQGMIPLVLGCALSEAVYLWAFEYGRQTLPLETEVGRTAAAGYLGDVLCRLIHLPLSIVAYRHMTINKFHSNGTVGSAVCRQPRSSLGTLRGLYREGGLRSIFCGLGFTLTVGSQWTAVWWAMYGELKGLGYRVADPFLLDDDTIAGSSWTDVRYYKARDDNFVLNSLASVTTSALTAVLFNPFLVLRVNMQMAERGRLWPTAKTLYRSGGWRAFYQGTYLNVATCIIDGFLASTSYEYAKLWADRTRHHD